MRILGRDFTAELGADFQIRKLAIYDSGRLRGSETPLELCGGDFLSLSIYSPKRGP